MPLTRDDIIFTREVPRHLVLDWSRFDYTLADIYGIGNFRYETRGDDIVVTVHVPAPFDLKKEVQDRGGCMFESDEPPPYFKAGQAAAQESAQGTGEGSAQGAGQGSSTESKK